MIEMMYVYEMKILDVRLRILVFVSIHRYYPTSLLPPHRTSNFGYLFISNFNYLFILISLDVRLFNSNFNYLFIWFLNLSAWYSWSCASLVGFGPRVQAHVGGAHMGDSVFIS